MSQKNPDPRAAVLRAAGHPEAADLLDALANIDAPADTAQAPVAPVAPPSSDDPARREGMQVLDAMRAAGVIPAAKPETA